MITVEKNERKIRTENFETCKNVLISSALSIKVSRATKTSFYTEYGMFPSW